MRLIYLFSFALAFALRADAQLFSDDFTRGTDPGPLGPWVVEQGNWSVTGGAFKGATNTLGTFAFACVTNSWTNYSVQARVRFASLNADGGGIGGRLDPFSGGHYAAWISPDGAGDPNTLELVKFQYWLGYEYTNTTWQPLARVSLPSVGTNWHTLKLAFQANQISVYYDSNLMATVTDNESNPFLVGGILASMSTANTAYTMFVDDVVVMPLSPVLAAFNDNYYVGLNGSLTVPAPGMLANDSPGSISNLTAVRLSNPSKGALTFNANGGFTYVPNNNFTGVDSFTYAATDGTSTSRWATVTVDVLPSTNNLGTNIFYDNFTRVAASNSFAPWVMAQGEWSVTNGTMLGGGTFNDYYSDAIIPGQYYGDISVQTRFQLPSGAWACGVSARVNPWTGERYVVNIYPETSPYKPTPSARLIKFHSWGTWNYPPGTALAQVSLGSVGTSVHTLRMNCYGNTIDVYYDGNQIIHAIDNMFDGIPFYRAGAFGAHMYMYTPYLATFDEFAVSQMPGVNFPPSLPAQPDQNVSPLATMVVTNTASDPDYPVNALSYTLLNPPAGATVDTNGIITWTPGQAQNFTTNIITTVVTDFFPSATNAQHLSATNSFNVIVGSQPMFASSSTAVAAESCFPTNNAIDSGETVTVLFGFQNIGLGNTTNLVATLLPGNGISSPSGPQTYGALTVGGPPVSKPFTFSANGSCGGTITAIFQMQDGSLNLGTVGVPLPVGQAGIVFTQAFDSVTAPALPSGWTTAATGVETNWVTQTAANSSPPNAAFVPDVANIGSSDLISPLIALPIGTSQLTFANSYDLETNAATTGEGFDGGVLDIRIGTNAFTDILAAGGSFITNGYTLPISTNWGNPLSGRMAWSGTSGGFRPTIVNLPPSAAGQNIQLRWRIGTDNSNSKPGWRIDSVGIVGRVCCANSGPVLGFQPNRTITEGSTLLVTNTATDPTTPPSGLTYTLLNPPAGAAIDTNGVISWTPTEVQAPGTNTITTVVTDNGSPPLSATNSFIVTVTETNSAPILFVPANQTINELTTLNVSASATDTDLPPNTLTFSLLSPPGGMTINPATGAISWTPSEAQGPSTNIITVVVTDNGSPPMSATNSFTVTVREVNTPPILTVPANQTINELTTLSVSASATDSDLPTNTLTFSLISPPSGMTINPATGAISWTPTEAQGPSTNLITVVVTDNGSPPMSATNSFTVTVREVNTPPVLTVPANQTINELTTLNVSASATDADIPTNTLTFSLISPPSGMTINPASGAISWTPTEAQGPSTNLITVVVTDNGSPPMSATNSFTVTVREVNTPPVLTVPANQTINELTTLNVSASATDTDIPTNTLTFSLISPPSGMTINPATGAISWTPTEAQGPSTNLITVVVTDNGSPPMSATNSFTVTVREVNTPPALTVPANQTINELTTLNVSASATDADIPTNTLTFSLISPPSGMTINPVSGAISWTPTEAQGPSTNVITVVVTDDGSPPMSATNSFTVTVLEVNTPPILTVPTNQTINELTTLNVSASATDADIPTNALTFSLISPPSGMAINPASGAISWTPTEAQGPGTNVITVVVTDNGVPPMSATNTFIVTVDEVNSAPVLPEQTNVTLVGLQTLLVTNTASDSDIPANTLTYALLEAPTNAVIDTNGIISWTPIASEVPSTNIFTTVVTDSNPWAVNSQHLTATNTFLVMVEPIHNGPTLPNQEAVAIDELTTLRITNTASDTDIPALTLAYELVNPPPGATIDTNGIITWTPTEAQGPSTNLLTTIVTDNGAPALSATNNVEVIVREVNQPPVLPVQTNYTIAGLTTIVITNTASDPDIPANPLAYTLLTAPTNAIIDTNGIITWTPVYAQVPSTNEFQTVVSDSNPLAVNEQSLSATNSFLVIVHAIRNPPVLPSQTNREIVEPATLVVTNTATENDIPVMPLIYQLMNPPAGAAIDTNGIITWTPTPGQAPGTNLIETVVMDATNGTGFNATNSFTVVVEPSAIPSPPVIQSIVISNGVAVLTWTTVPGHTYRLQSKEHLEDTNWTDIVPDILAAEPTATATDSITNSSQRFYRVFIAN